MPFRKWLITKNTNRAASNQPSATNKTGPRNQVRQARNENFTIDTDDDVKIVYMASDPPHEIVLSVVRSIAQNNAEVSQSIVSWDNLQSDICVNCY